MQFSILILVSLIPFVAGGTKCFSVRGTLKCEKDQLRAADAEIYLMDDDGSMNNDDQMGWTTSNEDGSFKLEGCGYDFTSPPDPYLKIMNICNGESVLITRITLPHTFLPETIDAGNVMLDLK